MVAGQKQMPDALRRRAWFQSTLAPRHLPGSYRLSFSRHIAYTESVKRAALRDVIQTRRLGHGGGADGAELVAQIQARSHRQTDPATDAGPDGDVLLTLYGP